MGPFWLPTINIGPVAESGVIADHSTTRQAGRRSKTIGFMWLTWFLVSVSPSFVHTSTTTPTTNSISLSGAYGTIFFMLTFGFHVSTCS